jgi:AcrR family transcriptional regulator
VIESSVLSICREFSLAADDLGAYGEAFGITLVSRGVPVIVVEMPRKPVISERRSRTRQRLIEAATKIVAEKGFDSATVDDIAEAAGFSIGGLYSNFSGKDELFLAVFDGHLEWFEQRLEDAQSVDDPAGAIADWLRLLGEGRLQFLVFVEFWAYAVRRPKLRREFAKRMAQMRVAMARLLEARAAETSGQLPIPAETLALLVLAILRGLALEKLASPRAVPDADVSHLLASVVPS